MAPYAHEPPDGVSLPHAAHLMQRRARIKGLHTAISRQAQRLAKKADEHEHLISKVTYCIGVLLFGTFCFLLGSRPHIVPQLYAAFILIAFPLRWVYYRSKKWHYFLLDFCYYANAILVSYLLFFPANDRLFLLCFAFAEGPLAWALLVWRCSLVFSSVDKIVTVLIHLLPGTAVFIIRWWDPVTYSLHPLEVPGPWPAWPLIDSSRTLWTWLFAVPLMAYAVWQFFYWLVVEVLRSNRLIRDPEVMTSFRQMSHKASRANNFWWKLSGVLGDSREARLVMYCVIQAVFTLATLAFTVLMFCNYNLHALFQVFKCAAALWNGCNFLFDVMPRKYSQKAHGRQHGKPQRPSPSPSRASPSPSRTSSSIPPLPLSDTSPICPTCHSHLPGSEGQETGCAERIVRADRIERTEGTERTDRIERTEGTEEKLQWLSDSISVPATGTIAAATVGDGGYGGTTDGLKGSKED